MGIDRRGDGDSTKFKATMERGRDYTHSEVYMRDHWLPVNDLSHDTVSMATTTLRVRKLTF